MKWSTVTLAAALAGGLWGMPAWAQVPVKPAPANSTGYYHQAADAATQASPSDAAGDMMDMPMPATDMVAGGGCTAAGCTDSGCGCNNCGCGRRWGCCDLGDPWDLGDKLFCPDSGWDLGGWFQLGAHSSNDGVFNTHPGSVDLQQAYTYLQKLADGSEGVGFGGRVDVLFGTDGSNTQAFGNHPGRWDYLNGFDYGIYGWAIPQAYGEVAYKKLNVKVGHFYTLLGYQVVPATGNFFYSIPYTFNFSEAFTHTGALATYTQSEKLTLYGGWTLGWDTGFDQLGGGNSFLGGASYAVTDKVKATYICTAGNLGWIGNNAYTHSFVVDYVINEKWEYVFQSDLDSIDNSINSGGTHYDTIGVNQYLFYTVNDCLRAGGRLEWWKADGDSLWETAVGLNYKPHANVLLRPEVRYNWVPGAGNLPAVLPVTNPLNATAAQDYLHNTIVAMDAIFLF